jgi:hypothetical protein
MELYCEDCDSDELDDVLWTKFDPTFHLWLEGDVGNTFLTFIYVH